MLSGVGHGNSGGWREISLRHIVLLGDSIFDNAAYTRGEPDVVSHLRSMLPPGWRASLLAVDGATTGRLPAQLGRIPADATDLVVSIGGNDALGHTDMLALPVSSTAEALDIFGERVEEFEEDYRQAVERVLAVGLPATLCTIYNGHLTDPEQARSARVALRLFNEVILREGAERRLPVIELRGVCTDPEDYANPIEPSGQGGRKIAKAILAVLGGDGVGSVGS